ncbi:MAG: peroxidase-related enzyme, partial [Alphaproteobacteria bacterium]|nr:peroxidase-related enzyme [Alphaproteobacteria bacterium]
MIDPHISQKISRFPVPEFSQLPKDIQQMLTDISDKAGFIPNVFLTLAYRPDELRAFFAYHSALMLRKGGISKAEKEMIIVATSAENSCLYCVIAHGAILRIYAKSGSLSDQIAT